MNNMRLVWRNSGSGAEKALTPQGEWCASRAAFSLIEMLVVLAILLILMTSYYSFGSRNHQKEQQKLCRANLEKIYVALQIYANEHDGTFPVVNGAKTSEEPLDVLVPRYTADTQSFICPGSKDDPLPSGESFRNHKISYAYFMGRLSSQSQEPLMSDRLVDTSPKNAGQIIFSTDGKPPGNNHHKYGGNFLFCDGRTEFSPSKASFSIVIPTNVVLLNPKP